MVKIKWRHVQNDQRYANEQLRCKNEFEATRRTDSEDNTGIAIWSIGGDNSRVKQDIRTELVLGLRVQLSVVVLSSRYISSYRKIVNITLVNPFEHIDG